MTTKQWKEMQTLLLFKDEKARDRETDREHILNFIHCSVTRIFFFFCVVVDCKQHFDWFDWWFTIRREEKREETKRNEKKILKVRTDLLLRNCCDLSSMLSSHCPSSSSIYTVFTWDGHTKKKKFIKNSYKESTCMERQFFLLFFLIERKRSSFFLCSFL